jgi:hypothetical protein
MNHLYKKLNLIAGAGFFDFLKKDKPKPSQLTPPQIGTLQSAASHSYLEIIDLISDGPIEGLIGKDGLKLIDQDILQGIDLDGVSVSVSNRITILDYTSFITIVSTTGAGGDPFLAQNIGQYFTNWSNIRPQEKLGHYVGGFDRPVTEYIIKHTGLPHFVNLDSQFNYLQNISGQTAETLSITSGTPLSRGDDNSYYAFTSDNYFTNIFPLDLSRYVSSPYSPKTPHPKTNVYIDDFKNKINLNSIFNLSDQDNTAKGYVRNYVDSLFKKRFGISWKKVNRQFLFSNWLSANIDFSKTVIFAVKAPSTDAIQGGIPLIQDSFGYNFVLQNSSNVDISHSSIKFYDFLIPQIDGNGLSTGRLYGFYIIAITGGTFFSSKYKQNLIDFHIPYVAIQELANASAFNLRRSSSPPIDPSTKYNYANIMAEFRDGEEYQDKFNEFTNVLVDKDYGSELIGPFRVKGAIQVVAKNQNLLNTNYGVNFIPKSVYSNGQTEGSEDIRKQNKDNKNFSSWNTAQGVFDESAISISHVIYNSNVKECYVTISVDSLSDTIDYALKNVSSNLSKKDKLEAGVQVPTIVNLSIEVGKIDQYGVETLHYTRKYKIVALILSTTSIDIGNPQLKPLQDDYKFIQMYDAPSELFTPFTLPTLDANNIDQKRYIRITKLSTETNSSLISKRISLAKVTEVIPLDFNYPYSAMVASKIDSRSFSSIPMRAFHCKLKKVKVPSNYFPSKNNTQDRRYYETVSIFNSTPKIDKRIYNGDWDGTFKDELEWTDNPAWILYDLITNDRYGLGQYMDESQVDVFDLYKIARFCDSVDDEGYFEGVSDSNGGLEPRFSCNIMFADGIKVFDALNVIASLFRGMIYYSNSQVNFVDDRPQDPIALFSNSNVKDGVFNYSNYRRDEQFNTIEVVYLDRFENFLTKIEYVEDEEDIRKRGVFKKTINANGVTSRSMARRLGKHLIYQTLKENQNIAFTSGLESLFCKPGDLIIVEDELKSLKSNFGKVLSTNTTSGSIRLSEKFINNEFEGQLTVYTPTGYLDYDEILDEASTNRYRLPGSGFYLNDASWNANLGSTGSGLTGFYAFDGYSDGYSDEQTSGNALLHSQYAYYTGNNSNFCYFSTQFTGWVLGSGLSFTDDNAYNKLIFAVGDHSFKSINFGYGYIYNNSISSGRGSQFKVGQNDIYTGADAKFRDIDNSELVLTRGIISSDISLTSPSQITTFDVSGVSDYEYGCEAFINTGDINYSLIPFIKQGSLYRFKRKLADDQIYKVISVKEESPNEYSIIGNLFNTGKYDLIERDKSIEYKSNTFSYSLSQELGGTSYKTLSPPIIIDLTTGIDFSNNFYISGRWKPVSNANGYYANLFLPNGSVESQDLNSETTSAVFYPIGAGNYLFKVKASGSFGNAQQNTQTYYDSQYSSSGLFIINEDAATVQYDRSYLSLMTIL